MKSFFFQSKALIAKILTRFGPKPKPKPRPKLKPILPLPSPGSQSQEALLFHLEGAVLSRSFLGFPYFMLVAFEAGGILRSLSLFLLYPLVRLAREELGLKIMVFVAFFGLREKSFRAGSAVLPKFLIQDSASQGVEAVMRFRRKICVTDLPRVMVEGFSVDWLGADVVFGRELKVICGYFVGMMEEENSFGDVALDDGLSGSGLVAMIGSTKPFRRRIHQRLLARCKEVYEVSESEKKTWQALEREKYPKPLIFHDGRLAFKPTFTYFLEMLTWLPFGLFLFIVRLAVALTLPHELSLPILSFTGMTGTTHVITTPKSTKPEEKTRGTLYVCNHRTLIDPVTLSMAIGKPVVAVTYSLSRVSELLSPIRTVRLSRSRSRDSETMERLLGRSDLVVCPEGTTCREPYLLRFSPMFAELTDEIVPVAVDFRSMMFYGTTAGGYKFLDPIFVLLNPRTECTVRVLEKLPPGLTCGAGGKSSVEVANYVQGKIGEALGFECTNFTRKDKYIVLAGNEGRV